MGSHLSNVHRAVTAWFFQSLVNKRTGKCSYCPGRSCWRYIYILSNCTILNDEAEWCKTPPCSKEANNLATTQILKSAWHCLWPHLAEIGASRFRFTTTDLYDFLWRRPTLIYPVAVRNKQCHGLPSWAEKAKSLSWKSSHEYICNRISEVTEMCFGGILFLRRCSVIIHARPLLNIFS